MNLFQSWKRFCFLLTGIGCIQSILLITLAMFFYAGGSTINADSIGYSLFENSLSDLGMTISYSGANNLLSCVIYNSSVFAFGILLVPFFITFPFTVSRTMVIRVTSTIASVFGIILGFAILGGSLTPADLSYENHVTFGAFGFIIGLPIAILLVVATAMDSSYPIRYTEYFALLAIIQFVFIILLGQQLGAPNFSATFSIGQKLTVYGISLCFLAQARYGFLKLNMEATRKHNLI